MHDSQPIKLARLREWLYTLPWRWRWLRLHAARMMFKSIPHGRLLGLEVTGVGEAVVEAVLPYREDLIGNPWTGALHSGPVTVLIDQLSGAAACLATRPPNLVATLDLRLDYLRAATPGKAVHARAHAYRVTRHIVFVKCEAHDGDPRDPIAIGTSCFMRNGTLQAKPLEIVRRALRRRLRQR